MCVCLCVHNIFHTGGKRENDEIDGLVILGGS